METLYGDIVRFMEEYFMAYSQHAQLPETQHLMDKFYAPDLTFERNQRILRQPLEPRGYKVTPNGNESV